MIIFTSVHAARDYEEKNHQILFHKHGYSTTETNDIMKKAMVSFEEDEFWTRALDKSILPTQSKFKTF